MDSVMKLLRELESLTIQHQAGIELFYDNEKLNDINKRKIEIESEILKLTGLNKNVSELLPVFSKEKDDLVALNNLAISVKHMFGEKLNNMDREKYPDIHEVAFRSFIDLKVLSQTIKKEFENQRTKGD